MPQGITDLYTQCLIRLRDAPIEQSRNGRVRTLQQPLLVTVERPWERLLLCPQRKANHYFHLMETIWMFAGLRQVGWLAEFNSGISNYAEPNGDINGAYGYRWRNHFFRDQIHGVVKELERDPDSRQAVIAMYDPRFDHQHRLKDRPCNTHIYFRRVREKLEMTVCNRSNDLVWGMAGANAVHMTMLHQLIAEALAFPMGRYHVMTNNLHIYEPHWPLMEKLVGPDHYKGSSAPATKILSKNVDLGEFLYECEQFMKYTDEGTYQSRFLNDIVVPMYQHYTCRLNGDLDTYDINETRDSDWRLFETSWREWNGKSD